MSKATQNSCPSLAAELRAVREDHRKRGSDANVSQAAVGRLFGMGATTGKEIIDPDPEKNGYDDFAEQWADALDNTTNVFGEAVRTYFNCKLKHFRIVPVNAALDLDKDGDTDHVDAQLAVNGVSAGANRVMSKLIALCGRKQLTRAEADELRRATNDIRGLLDSADAILAQNTAVGPRAATA